MNTKDMLFYLAGPYSSDPERNYLWHLLESERLKNAGIMCFSSIVKTHRWHGQYPHSHEQWIKWDLRWIELIKSTGRGAFIRLPGDSPGSDVELSEAKKLGLPIWIGHDPVNDVIEGKDPTLPAKAYDTGRTTEHDPVQHPSHYTQGGIETIDFIEAKRLDYHRGNVVKYVTRAGRKDPETEIEDLEKAGWYIERAIKEVRKQGSAT
jgi:hypothetical protein